MEIQFYTVGELKNCKAFDVEYAKANLITKIVTSFDENIQLYIVKIYK